MFEPKFLVQDAPNTITTVTFDLLAQDLLHGRRSPLTPVCDVMNLGARPWVRACEHPSLRRLVLARVTTPGLLTQIIWAAPSGALFYALSREGFGQAVRDGNATQDTITTIHTPEAWFLATGREFLPPEQSGGWGVGATLFACTASVLAVGATVYGVQRYRYNHEPVSLRDTSLRAELYSRDEGTCGLCGEGVDPAGFHLDHKHPRALNGEDTRANLQVAHPWCNQSKGAKPLEEYLRSVAAPH